jgi:DNA-binding NarL/FixJ family response regulator
VLLLFPSSPVPVFGPWRILLLSPEERRMLALDARGLTSRQIASRFGRSPRWVRYQLQRIHEFLGQAPRPRVARHRPGEK